MYRHLSIFAIVLLVSACGFAEGEQKFADLGQCRTESGVAIEGCRIGYRTWGALNAEKSNVVVMLTWFGGNSGALAQNVGADKYVDPAKYFVVAIDAVGDGVSSSPSNSTAQPRMKFPHITIADMVQSQHQLLTDSLHLQHVHAIWGASMGGMQAFQWAVQYPGFADVIVTQVGSTKLTAHDLLLWRGETNAIVENKDWNSGNYQPGLLIRSVSDIQRLELTTPQELNRRVNPADFDKVEANENFDPNDRLRQLEAMMSLDISKKFGGDMTLAAKAIKARMLIVVGLQDHMVNSQPAIDFAGLLHVQAILLDSDCGHLAPGCAGEKVTPAVQKALAAE
ncbi:MAG TPA: alpha/beta fold hydrolase [Candidatus Koribacter sp.]|jgi:homoserine O-acetyltransferase